MKGIVWYVVLGLVGAGVLIFLLVKLILWIVELGRLRRENWSVLARINQSFEELTRIFPKAVEDLENLKQNYPKSVWEEVDFRLGHVHLNEPEGEIAMVKNECERSIFHAKTARASLDSVTDELKRDIQAVEAVGKKKMSIFRAELSVNEKLTEIYCMMVEIERLMSKDDLSKNIIDWYERAKVNFLRVKSDFDLLNSKPTDWIHFARLFAQSHNLMKVSRDSINTEISLKEKR